jgi:hypothetical protein
LIGTQDLQEKFSLVRSDALTFNADRHVQFDLGADKPHSFYYTSDGTADGCATDANGNPVTGDPCKGKLTLSASGSASTDTSTALAGAS